MPIDLTKHKPVTAAEIYCDLVYMGLQLGPAVPCMIAAKCLGILLQPGDWNNIKTQLMPDNILVELNNLKNEGGK